MTDGPEEPRLHRLFERHAANAPERIAFVCEQDRLSYDALNRRANRLAHLLIARGVGPEVPVALCVERSADLPIGLLAIQKAGGCYVPLDPEHPRERLDHILADTAAAIVIAQASTASRLRASARDLLLLERDAVAIAAQPDRDPDVAIDPTALSYVMYTSGSTGRPKGVLIEHRALAARFATSPYRELLAPGQVLAAITHVSWNPSVFEVLFSLARGATIAMATRDVVRDPARVPRFLEEHGVTFMRAVPSLWQAMIDAGWQGRRELAILCHGERLSMRLEQELTARGRGVWNHYGATEATVFSRVVSTHTGRRVLAPGASSSSGSLRALGPDLAPTGIGEVGEIHIGGEVVARGYLGDPSLTRTRFAVDPLTDLRLYKTGDLGRPLADGSLELLGRADDQVKIRGQRVELGEVEAAIAAFAGVAEAVAVVREDTPGDQRLVAYLVPETGAVIRHDELRAHLRATVPDFMRPSAFVVLERLPLTPHGKVDRAALPAPRRARPPFAGDPQPPTNDLEATVAALFSEVLGCDAIGIDDDFFALGGHSLLAAQVAARVKTRLAVDLSLVAFFENATPRALAAVIDRRRAAGDRALLPALQRVTERRHAPLSFAQERLWFLNRLGPGDFAYNLPSATRLHGPLDVPALEAALRVVLERHEALRTRFEVDAAGRPTQTVVALAAFDLPLVSHEHVGREDERLEHLRAALARASLEPFDLSDPPLFRAALHRLSPTDHVLFVSMHHIASDGWSKAVLRRELARAYRASARGLPLELPPLPVQLLDFASWQRRHLAGSELARQLAYWRTELAGLETLALPTDHPRPKVFSHRGAREVLRLPPALRRGLEALAHRSGASLFMVLLAAFDVLLYRYTGQTDIAIGSPIAGRNLPEIEGLVGFFVNTLVLRARLDGALRFSALLAQVKQTALSAYAHQDLPFERLVSELNPERDMGRHPLVQVVLALQNTPWEEVPFAGLVAEPFELPHPMTRLDLELHVWERDDGLSCHLIYSTDLFEAWRMRQLLGHLEVLLAAVVADPDACIEALPILPPPERERLLVDWNATARDYPRDRCLHELFAEQAARAPDALAILRQGERLTYGELAARGRQFSRHLRRCGVGAGDRVALGLPRSPSLFVAILGVLEAGAAWVPLDPDYPPARLDFMLTDCGAPLLVTLAALRERFSRTRIPVLCLDEEWPEPGSERSEDPPRPGDPDALAYVIYTSGSTGSPNGVAIAHRGVVNLATWFIEAHGVSAADRATLLASPSFDASVLESWPYLLAGASLHMPDDDTRGVPARLASFFAREAITIGFVPTALLEPLLGLDLSGTRLRALVTGGDRLTRRPPDGARFFLYNHYGPTENSVCSTSTRVLPASEEPGPPPIGRPIANTRAFVLDRDRNLVPIGVPGELHLAGVGLARGYAGRPELTATRFISSPFGDERLYRTGDLVRHRPDGQLEFLGRLDAQIKLRGYRIEPGEVDAAIAAIDGVRESITLVREDAPGDRRLVSYLVPEPVRRDDPLVRDYLARWQALYDGEYAGAHASEAEGALAGWNSSFTGRPIPAHEMREWVDARVAEITRHRPEAVLEVGCGTGLLLFPVADIATRYVATDFSRRAIAGLQRRLAADPALADRVALAARPAHDLEWLGDRTFDTVILNSVVQYFPSADYLADVLARAVARVRPGGRVFVGDVRNHDLLRDFHAAVVRARAGEALPASELEQRVEAEVLRDKELLLGPGFFHELARELPRVTAVEVRPERGRARNEMTMFRYDVTLHVERPARPIALRALTWGEEVRDLAELERILREPSVESLLLKAIPDARRSGASEAVDLEALHALGAALERRCDVRLALGSRHVDALFLAPDDARDPIALPNDPGARSPLGAYASDPLRQSLAQRLLPEVRAHLRAILPEHMVPSALVVLDALPLTANGKLDKRRLPRPRLEPPERLPAAPRTDTERRLSEIFAHALGVPAVGLTDDFFALGGHSLLAVQVVSAIHDRCAVDLPLAALFEAPTVEALAARVDAARGHAARLPPEPDPALLTRLPFTPMDVNFHYGKVFFRAGRHAWHQVLQLDLAPLDLARLEAACLYAVNRHPVARGRVSAHAALGEHAYWDVGARLTEAPLSVHDARDDDHLEALTDAIVATPLALDEAPSVRFALLRAAHRDRLLVRYNHGAIDGSGLRCLVGSLASHYLGEPDPARRVVPLTTAELLAYYQHPESTAAPLARLLDHNELAHVASLVPDRLFGPRRHARLGTRLSRPSRIFPSRLASSGGDPGSRATETVELTLTDPETRSLTEAARYQRTTLDRLFIIAFLDGAVAWNRAHQRDASRVEAYWAVNLRPPRLYDSIVGNQFAWSRVRAPAPSDRGAWLERVRDPASDFLLRGALDFARFVERFHRLDIPDAVRRLSMTGIKVNAPTLVISNTLTLGELELGAFSEAFGVRGMKLHSRRGFTDRPVVIIGNRAERIHLRMLYPRALLDSAGALGFLETCRDAALALARRDATGG